ncbi:flagellar biosynthetic protein FliO [Sulfuriflexus mobilis]|uniref:flagellar biosynthetic protein FliO n=1 Tax=Sulfuriflexus mobilis TaxID=1811807 RepID=UPI000F84685F|nr:flagellar biosynthetic protein FliO [Sulfuriflexus mobilis]
MSVRQSIISCLYLLPMASVSAQAAETLAQADKTVGRVNVEPVSGGTLAQVALGLLLVLCLILAVAWLLKRVGGFSVSGNGALKILGGLSMGARERVVLMQVGEEQILIGVSPGRVQTLHVLNKPVVDTAKANTEIGFADRLAEALGRKREA